MAWQTYSLEILYSIVWVDGTSYEELQGDQQNNIHRKDEKRSPGVWVEQ